MSSPSQSLDKVVGFTSSPEQRALKQKQNKQTNFKMGITAKPRTDSLSHGQYQTHTDGHNNFNIRQADVKMKTTNFNTGDGKTALITTSNSFNYQGPPSNFKTVKVDQTMKDELRTSHWTYGAHQQHMKSVTMSSFPQELAGKGQIDKTSGVLNTQMQRTHHFTFGSHNSDFKSQMKSTHKVAQGAAKMPNTDQAKLKQEGHHFQMGFTNGSMKTSHTKSFFNPGSQSKEKASRIGDEINSSIQFGDEFKNAGVNRRTNSVSHGFVISKDIKDEGHLVADRLRKHNFDLGFEQLPYNNVNAKYGEQFRNKDNSEYDDYKKRIFNSSLQVGNDKMNKQFFKTTNGFFFPKNENESRFKREKKQDLKFTSDVKLTGNKVAFPNATQMKATHQEKKDVEKYQAPTDFKPILKQDHFDFTHVRHDIPDHYKSTYKRKHYTSDNPSDLKAQFNQFRAKDFQSHHFEYGNPKQVKMPQNSTSTGFYQSPEQRKKVPYPDMHNNALSYKHQSFKMQLSPHQKMKETFASNNMLQYKWIQPQFQ